MKRISLLFSLMLFVVLANATVYLIQPGGSGASWSGVSGTIVDLTTEAKSLNSWYSANTFAAGDEIWIIKGTYVLTDSLKTQSSEKIYGGFAGTEQTVDNRTKGANAWDFTNETILDGNAAVRGISSKTGATIDGLSIQNCAFVGGSAIHGAAARIAGASVMQNCIIRNNTIAGTSVGGGIFLTGGAKLLNSYIHHNTTTGSIGHGGGVYVSQLATIDGCTISNNVVTGSGAGIYVDKSAGTKVTNCIITANEAITSTTAMGGGLAAAGSNTYSTTDNALAISGCTITSNKVFQSGGGLYIDVPTVASPTTIFNLANVSNCTISSNSTTNSAGTAFGAGLYLKYGKFTVSGCTVNSNTLNAANAQTNGGAGLYAFNLIYGSLALSNSVFKSNTNPGAAQHGSALFLETPSTITNCVFTANSGFTYIYQNPARASVYQNCTFAGNVNSTGESSMYLGYGLGVINYFTNCIFYKVNATPIGASAIGSGKNPVVTYCAFNLGSVPTVCADQTGCITSMSLTAFADYANGNLNLSTTSALLNKGTTIAAVTTDINGVARPQGAEYDMGAYEVPFYNTTITFNTGGTVDAYTSGDVKSQVKGSQFVATITPATGKGIKSVLYNGVEVKEQLTDLVGTTYYKGGKYTSAALTAASTLVVEFETDTTTGLKDVNQFKCYSVNRGIVLNGLSAGSRLTVYNATGAMVLNKTINSTETTIPLAPGVYGISLVEEGKSFTQKILVK